MRTPALHPEALSFLLYQCCLCIWEFQNTVRLYSFEQFPDVVLYQVSKASDWFMKARWLSSTPGSRLDSFSSQEPHRDMLMVTKGNQALWEPLQLVNTDLPPIKTAYKSTAAVPLYIDQKWPLIMVTLPCYMLHYWQCLFSVGRLTPVVSCRGEEQLLFFLIEPDRL